jgi:hypothetical protein
MMPHPKATFDTWGAKWKSSDSQVGLARVNTLYPEAEA